MGRSWWNLRYWEIFNEPNSPGFGWFAGRNNAAYTGDELLTAYVYTLAVSNVTIRAVDPNAVIVLGGLSPDGYPPFDYLKKIYALGAKNCFDVVAFHPYAYENKFFQAAASLRAITTSYGDASKPIWFNEYGTTDNARRATVLNEAQQQKTAVNALFWYTLIDYSNTSDGSWGVVDMNYTKKPEYYLLKTLLQ